MTPFHPRLRHALLRDSENRKEDVFEITENTVQSLELGKTQGNLRKRIDSIKNKKIRGKDEFLKTLRTTIGDKNALEKYEQLILENTEQTGLTSERLLEYEGLIAQLHYLTKYASTSNISSRIAMLFRQIENFKTLYLPNFDAIRDDWVKKQQNATKNKYCDLNPINLFKLSLTLIWAWFLPAIFCKIFKSTTAQMCAKFKYEKIAD